MKLERIIENLNSFEKNSFLKIIDSILTDKPKNAQAIEKILMDSSRDLKNMDNINISKVFSLVEDEFIEYIREEFIATSSQLDILTDIISRDGNCIMKKDWFARLYENMPPRTRSVTEFRRVMVVAESFGEWVVANIRAMPVAGSATPMRVSMPAWPKMPEEVWL